MSGRVIIAGAGCGDYDLITMRGYEALKSCDVVIYDSLIDSRLLDFCKENAQKICVGKRAGRHSSTQEEINTLLVEKAAEGGVVLRLKGGDPFVFGRGGEEITALKAAGIPYSLIPGVTSSVAVPELAGIPVSHRGLSRSFHVITGHTADDLLPEHFESYAKCGGTLIFLMGLRNLPEIAGRLIENGMDENTPATVISKGATPEQRAVKGCLGDIAEKVKREDLPAPAVIIVGETAGLDLSPTYLPPLYGASVAVTATKGLSRRLIKSLNALGAYAHRCGGFELRELNDEVTEKAFSRLSEGFYSHIALTSPNGAEIFLKRLRESRIDIRKLSEVKIAVIGKGTGAKLEKAGLYADIMPEKFNSVALGNTLSDTLTPEDRLLIVRSSEGSAELVKPLAEKGLNFDDVHIYEPVYSTGEKIDDDYAVFASAGGVRSFFRGGGSLSENIKCISIGEVTAAELKKYGINSPLLPTESGISGLLIFGIPEKKDELATEAYNDKGVTQQAIRYIKEHYPDMLVIADVCLCEYTSHGHCGVVKGDKILNDSTLPLLCKMAVSLAKAGADIIAPSDMMDGRVAAIRAALDENALTDIPIMSYSAKFASGYYSPFRDAAESAPCFGDRKSYQMDPCNGREALREIEDDIEEGADMVMVKPALCYLDILRAARDRYDLPIAAYNVSGEFSMVKAAAQLGWIDEKRIVLENLTAIKRAGADIIITYHALDAAKWIKEDN